MKRVLLAVLVSSVALAEGAPHLMGEGVPVIGPAPKWTPPVPEVRALKSGAKAWVLTRAGLPLVTVSWVVPAGLRHEGAAWAGLASLTAEALHECGAGTRGPQEFQEALEALGATLSLSTGVEGTSFSFTVVSSRLDAALALLVDLLSRPRFDPVAFDALKARHLAELKAALDEPSTVASLTAFRALYGTQPEGRPTGGEVATVEKVTLDDVKAFHAARYGSAGATVVVVGDLSADAVKQKLDAAAAKAWLGAPVAVDTSAPVRATAKWLGVEKKGAPQTVLLGLAPGLPWRSAGLAALTLAGDVLGGSFTSRLNQNIRERHGYSYGAMASVAPGRIDGVVEVMTPVRADVTGAALEQVVLELRGLTSVTPEENEKAIALAKASMVAEFSSSAGIAAAFSDVALLGGTPEHLRSDFAALLATTADQTKTATRAFDPEGFTFVLVGDKASIDAQLKKTHPTKKLEWVEAR